MQKLFISIDVNDDIAGSLNDCVKKLPDLGETRIVPEENYHITVHFIGPTDENALGEIEHRIDRVAHTSRPFVLQPKEITLAPPGRISTMLWAIFEEEREFTKLSDGLQRALHGYGSDRKERIPHVTLIRSRKPLGNIGRSADIKEVSQLYVGQITLMESIEIQGGVYYKPLAHFSLGQ